MSRATLSLFVVVVLLLCAARHPVSVARPIDSALTTLAQQFADPPPDSRVMMRWWWFGPAVTREGIERELLKMKEGGIGGVEIQPVYPLALDGSWPGLRSVPFLSDEFLTQLGHAATTGRRLGMRVDLTLGSGWPFGGPSVTIDDAAGQLRVVLAAVEPGTRRVPLPVVEGGERIIAAFRAMLDKGALSDEAPARVEDLRDGAAWLDDAARPGETILFYVASRTGMQVKRAAVGAEGFVLDHYDRGALDRYLDVVGKPLLAAFGDAPPEAIFCDSLEVFGSNWTSGFLEEFQRRRGYDLTAHLPALTHGRGPRAEGLREDWGRTLTELYEEHFLAPLADWARRHGTRLRIQNYGIPPATIGASAHADLPEGEGWQWRALTASRWASSASHLYSRPVASAETWTWLHSPTFRATPLDLKAEADQHFLQGITQLVGHGWPYSPDEADPPGWRFYAAGAFTDENPWWIVMPDLTRYLQRISFVLRTGRPANDVALYLPNGDAWAAFGEGRLRYMLDALAERIGPDVIPAILDSGLNFDFFDDESLAGVGRVEGDRLRLGANGYRIVVLPNVERMPVATMRTLAAFADAGGVVVAVGRIPARASGYLAASAEDEEIRSSADRLFRAGGAGHVVATGGATLSEALGRLLIPDVRLERHRSEIGFVHRALDDADVYFVANTANRRLQTNAVFRVGRQRAEFWDPLDGRIRPAPVVASGDGVSVPLELEPYGTRLIVFTEGVPSTERAPGDAVREVADLSAGWTVRFPGEAPREWTRLKSWTEDVATRHFSGVVTYERSVHVPEGLTNSGTALRLHFGESTPLPVDPKARFRAWLEAPVREAAVVYANGRRAGSVWLPPYSVDVTSELRAGRNELRVEVGNLALNRMAGRTLPDFRLLNLRYGVRFENQDQEAVRPIPAGLLGAVRLLALPAGQAPP